MRFWLICIFFNYALTISGQGIIPYIPINSSNPNDTNFADFTHLDSIVESRQIIGIGEATHGTSEFTTMRHRLLRYLVEKHQFNTFFLEADFGACQRINRYIHGETDTVKLALDEVKLWPWRTEEMISMINWMRSHNLRNQQNQIQFVGCDMQFISSNILELNRFLITIKSSYINEVNKFSDRQKLIDNADFRDSLKVLLKNIEAEFIDLHLDNSRITEFFMLNQTILQWLSHDAKVRDNTRDSCMAINMLTYLKLVPNTKGLYFAHNSHVSRMSYNFHETGYQNKWTGYYLNERLGTKYFTIAQDLLEGSFVAMTYGENKMWEFKEFYLPPADKKSIGYYFSKFGKDNLFCLTKDIPKLKRKRNTFIGAVYGKNERGINQVRYGSEGIFFDAFIFIKTTTASHVYFLNK